MVGLLAIFRASTVWTFGRRHGEQVDHCRGLIATGVQWDHGKEPGYLAKPYKLVVT